MPDVTGMPGRQKSSNEVRKRGRPAGSRLTHPLQERLGEGGEELGCRGFHHPFFLILPSFLLLPGFVLIPCHHISQASQLIVSFFIFSLHFLTVLIFSFHSRVRTAMIPTLYRPLPWLFLLSCLRLLSLRLAIFSRSLPL